MTLEIFLLDGAQGLITIPFFFFLHMVTTIWIEGYLLKRCGYKPPGKNTLDALLANLASLVVGLGLLSTISDETRHIEIAVDPLLISLFLHFIPTLVVEWVVLKLLNYNFSPVKLLGIVLLMNTITYVTLYFILKLMNTVE
jgi:hypothetical protein